MSTTIELDQAKFDPKSSSTGLTVLLVLTGLMLLFSLGNSIYNMFKYDTVDAMEIEFADAIDQMEQGMPDFFVDAYADMFASILENYMLMSIFGWITVIIGIAAVVLMAQRYKSGFMVYVIYSIAGVLSALLMGMNFVTYITVGFYALISLLFIWLYSRQRKYLYK